MEVNENNENQPSNSEGGHFAGWSEQLAKPTETQHKEGSEEQIAATAAAAAEAAAAASSNEENDNSVFNQEKFLSDFKEKNPEATQEQIEEAANKGEDDFYTAGPDLFKSKKEEAAAPKNDIFESFKSVAGEDFDEIAHSSVNSREEFQEALKGIVDKRVNKGLEEQSTSNDFVDKMNETDKAVFNIMKQKGLAGVKEFLEGDQRISSYLKMTDEALVIEGYRGKKDASGKSIYTALEISQKIANFDEGSLALEAKGLRAELTKIDGENRSNTAKLVNEDAALRGQESFAEKTKMGEQIRLATLKSDNFHGIKLDPATAVALEQNYVNGDFDHLFKDPNFIKNAILFDKLGDKAIKRHGKMQYEKARSKQNQSDHNVKDLPNQASGSGNSGTNAANGSGYFKDWGKSQG